MNLGPVTNAEWDKFRTHLFPNRATCIDREGVNKILDARQEAAVNQRQALVDVLKEIVTIANREYAVSIGNQWAWAKVEDKAEAALKAVGEC